MLNHAVTKRRAPTSSRDLCVAGEYSYSPDGTISSAFTSVVDDKVPPVSGNVRLQADLIAWKLVPHASGTMLSHWSQTNPMGWIPSAVLQSVAAQVPLVIPNIAKYMSERGPPPSITHFGADPVKYTLDDDEPTYKWTAELRVNAPWTDAGVTRIIISTKSFARGAAVEMSPPDAGEARWLAKDSSLEFRFVRPGTVNITVRRGKSDSGFNVTVNGAALSMDGTVASGSSGSVNSSSSVNSSNSSSSSSVAPVSVSSVSSVSSFVSVGSVSRASLSPSSPALPPNFAAVRDEMMADFKSTYAESVSSSPLWEEVPSVPGATMWKRSVPMHPLGYIKCTTVVRGFTPEQVYAVLEIPACRAKCTSRQRMRKSLCILGFH